MVIGLTAGVAGTTLDSASSDRIAAQRLRAVKAGCSRIVEKSQTLEFLNPLLNLRNQRTASHGHNDGVGHTPTELLCDFVAKGL